jgi:hypothetical protein
MGNETEKDFQRNQTNPNERDDKSKRNQSQHGGQNPNQQDPSRKNPSQGQRDNQEGSDQVEKRRAS